MIFDSPTRMTAAWSMSTDRPVVALDVQTAGPGATVPWLDAVAAGRSSATNSTPRPEAIRPRSRSGRPDRSDGSPPRHDFTRFVRCLTVQHSPQRVMRAWPSWPQDCAQNPVARTGERAGTSQPSSRRRAETSNTSRADVPASCPNESCGSETPDAHAVRHTAAPDRSARRPRRPYGARIEPALREERMVKTGGRWRSRLGDSRRRRAARVTCGRRMLRCERAGSPVSH